MPRWIKPTEELPESWDVGDRILGIVRAPHTLGGEPRLFLVIFTGSEDMGWQDHEYGYSLEDCELWAHERDVCQIADSIR